MFSQDMHLQSSKVGNISQIYQAEEAGLSDAFQARSAVIHWNNVGYAIAARDKNIQILKDIHGWVKPGTLTALMVSPHGRT